MSPENYRKVKVNLKEIEEQMRKNKEDRLKFIDLFAQWIKKTPNQVWSKHQKEFIK